jgi:hypothetical protein
MESLSFKRVESAKAYLASVACRLGYVPQLAPLQRLRSISTLQPSYK